MATAELQPTRTASVMLPSTAPRPLLMIVLLCDMPLEPVRAKHGTYHAIFTTLFAKAARVPLDPRADSNSAAATEPTQLGPELTVESYDVVNGVYPSDDRVKEADALLLTGSATSAYLPLPWIDKLVAYTAALPSLKPGLKIIGICYGHQIVARAFGAVVEKNARGWEIGVREMRLTESGRRIFGNGRDVLTIHQMHQDHVPSLPAGFESLGSTDICPVHGMVRYAPRQDNDASSTKTLQDVQVITLQGHPEFTPDIVQKVIDVRQELGVFSSELAEQSRRHAVEHDEGVWIGRVLLGIMGVE